MAARNSGAEKGAVYNGKSLSDGDREETEHTAAHDAAARGHLATDASVYLAFSQAMLTVL